LFHFHRPKFRFVRELSEAERQQLDDTFRSHPEFGVRRRAHAVLLSAKGHPVGQLQDLLDVDRDTVSLWIKQYEQSGLEGLLTRPRPGRNPIYTDGEIQQLKDLVDADPRRIKAAQAALEAATGKTACLQTLRRALKIGSATPGTAAAVR
jgi:transposase